MFGTIRLFSLLDRVALAGIGAAELRPRFQCVELLRIASAFGIVYFHTRPAVGSEYAYAGLMVFLFLMTYFEAQSSATFIKPLSSKLILPWSAWLPVYCLVDLVRPHHQLDLQNGLIPALLQGPSPHLWFLPFAFIVCAAIRIIKRSQCKPVIGRTFALIALCMTATMSVWVPLAYGFRHPYEEYTFAAVPSLLGVSLAFSPTFGAFAVLGSAAICAAQSAAGFPVGISYALAFVAVFAALKAGSVDWLDKLHVTCASRFMIGVYLVHPLIISAVNTGGGRSDFGKAATVFVICTVLTWVMSGRASARAAQAVQNLNQARHA